jgi:hypothetical protein
MASTARPAPTPEPWEARRAANASIDALSSPVVAILDTGLAVGNGSVDAAHPAITDAAFVIDAAPSGSPTVVDDIDVPDSDNDGWLDREAGHGTFISGIVRRLAPDATIVNLGVLTGFGDGDDFTVGQGIARLLGKVQSVDVVNLSLSGYTDDDGPPLAIAAAIRALCAAGNHPVVVAAAGNNASSRPAYPAALDDVIGVAATDDVTRAWFSNYGRWVDACAPGVDVVSTFFVFDGKAVAADGYSDPDAFRDGWAVWSGTSFSAPKVAAQIARYMSDHGVTARVAADALVYQRGLFRVPDLGVVVNVV